MNLGKIRMDVSIIICCYNSANRIVPTLEYLARQNLSNVSCELIIVDNNCSDDTVDVARATWSSLGEPISMVLVSQNLPGQSNARKTGVIAAKGELIVFCDDDNWLDENYVLFAHEVMNSNKEIGVLAGQSRAVSNIEIPTWFYTHYGNYACGVLGLHSGDISSRLWVWGAGMVLRKSFMMDLYSKYTHITNGRTKDSMESSDDVEICCWHILEKKQIWYDNRLELMHYMPPNRLTIENAEKQFKGQYESSTKMTSLTNLTYKFYLYYNGGLGLKSIVRHFLKFHIRQSFIDFKYYLKFKLNDRC
jgi:glycosyltransferase involved in cell wall biosynthesis